MKLPQAELSERLLFFKLVQICENLFIIVHDPVLLAGVMKQPHQLITARVSLI